MAEAELRTVQLHGLEMLLEVDRICRAHGLRHQLAAGTLLGAIRHQGFIPWDDDVDVCLPRADYEAFLRLAPAEIDPRLRIRSRESDPDFGLLFAKVEPAEGSGFHPAAYVDVFPFDAVAPDTALGRLHLTLHRLGSGLLSLARLPGSAEVSPRWPLPARIGGRLLWPLARWIGTRRLASLLDRIARLLEGRETGAVACLVSGSALTPRIRTVDSLAHRVEVPFEGHLLPAPHDHDKVLRSLYGDYRTLPPPEMRVPAHLLAPPAPPATPA